MKFDGYLRKYLKQFDDEWMQRKGWRFRDTCRFIFIEMYEELRQLEMEGHNVSEMNKDIEFFAWELFASLRNPMWDARYKFYIHLYVNIHALVEKRGLEGVSDIQLVYKKTRCKEILQILKSIPLATP